LRYHEHDRPQCIRSSTERAKKRGETRQTTLPSIDTTPGPSVRATHMKCAGFGLLCCGQSESFTPPLSGPRGDSRVPPPACVRQSTSCCRSNNCHWPTASWCNFPSREEITTLSCTPTTFPTHGRTAHQVGGVVRGASRALATAAAPLSWGNEASGEDCKT